MGKGGKSGALSKHASVKFPLFDTTRSQVATAGRSLSGEQLAKHPAHIPHVSGSTTNKSELYLTVFGSRIFFEARIAIRLVANDTPCDESVRSFYDIKLYTY
ncbi:hypothetical protein RRG08_038194 [Elysia crispata]|uniref:Uncharacterized protein n=1 Tax=Elysia crispata TaxID=231223 RepID=A0AAE1AMT7_9GAST|nr:hypothetical protein RRG08_038194 [Elysia crispata]